LNHELRIQKVLFSVWALECLVSCRVHHARTLAPKRCSLADQ
jgi:hypothetical protein